jgi:hypothetical protein
VIITGTHFTGTTSVIIGGVPAGSFIVISDREIDATAGAGATGVVLVLTPNGSDSLGTFTFVKTLQVPHIISFSPTTGTSGTQVSIRGTGFTGVNRVSFGGVAAGSFIIASDSSISAIVGSGATGPVLVASTTVADSLAGFIYISSPGPVINSFTPDSAATAATVTIRGSGFTGTTSVDFGGTPASSFLVLSDSVISAIVGDGSTGLVSVRTPNAGDSLAGFIFLPDTALQPQILSFSPASGNAGATITIIGQHFTGTTSVTIGGVTATSFTVISDSVIVAIVGSGAVSGNITVTTPAGSISVNPFVVTTGLVVFPNPASGTVTINFPLSSSRALVNLTDYSGRLVTSIVVKPGETTKLLNLYGVQLGAYVISWGDGSTTLRRIILIK